jgi:hypothetical protein
MAVKDIFQQALSFFDAPSAMCALTSPGGWIGLRSLLHHEYLKLKTEN